MSIGDQKLHRELLISIYEALDHEFHGHAETSSLLENFEDLDGQQLQYHLNRLEENRLIERRAAGTAQLTANGVEQLDKEGYDTFLQTDTRYEILRVAYEKEREEHVSYIDAEALREEIGISHDELHQNRWYLAEKGLINLEGHNLNFQLSGEGRNSFEEYRDEGMPIPRTHPLQRFTQHTIGQGDREKAENVFRAIVELAREQVIIVDMYAKGFLYEMLEHVPSIVDVKILMSHKELSDENTDLYRQYSEGRGGEVELRYLNYWDDYPFHSREVIRDREAGWIWDHTFADAGGRHHTISQLRPVNLENDLEAFDEAWSEAEIVE